MKKMYMNVKWKNLKNGYDHYLFSESGFTLGWVTRARNNYYYANLNNGKINKCPGTGTAKESKQLINQHLQLKKECYSQEDVSKLVEAAKGVAALFVSAPRGETIKLEQALKPFVEVE